ncbi:hypothetical protein ACRALDRAFT_2047173 [Sodiomyces alcalophilus JCM 7366]|uniref:uncharacterized protein n=1 Tax=Sodiomyces alcalophilus JCM 7366 TaxID=591952 RepID=UPI0039B495D8
MSCACRDSPLGRLRRGGGSGRSGLVSGMFLSLLAQREVSAGEKLDAVRMIIRWLWGREAVNFPVFPTHPKSNRRKAPKRNARINVGGIDSAITKTRCAAECDATLSCQYEGNFLLFKPSHYNVRSISCLQSFVCTSMAPSDVSMDLSLLVGEEGKHERKRVPCSTWSVSWHRIIDVAAAQDRSSEKATNVFPRTTKEEDLVGIQLDDAMSFGDGLLLALFHLGNPLEMQCCGATRYFAELAVGHSRRSRRKERLANMGNRNQSEGWYKLEYMKFLFHWILTTSLALVRLGNWLPLTVPPPMGWRNVSQHFAHLSSTPEGFDAPVPTANGIANDWRSNYFILFSKSCGALPTSWLTNPLTYAAHRSKLLSLIVSDVLSSDDGEHPYQSGPPSDYYTHASLYSCFPVQSTAATDRGFSVDEELVPLTTSHPMTSRPHAISAG